MQPDLPWTILLSRGLYATVYLGGLAAAIVNWRKHPGVSRVVAAAMIGLLWWSWWMLSTEHELQRRLVGMPPEKMQWEFWVRSVPFLIAFAVLVITAFARRGRREPEFIVREEVPRD